MASEDSSNGLITPLLSLVGLVAALGALIKSMVTDGHKSALKTNEGLFETVATLQGMVNTLLAQQSDTVSTQNKQAEKIGKLEGKVEELERVNGELQSRASKAEAAYAKEAAAHVITKATLKETLTNLAKVTEKYDELLITVDEKIKREREQSPVALLAPTPLPPTNG